MDDEVMPRRRFASVRRLVEMYADAGITEASIRWARFKNLNDFNRCVCRLGRRIVIDVDAFENWLLSTREMSK